MAKQHSKKRNSALLYHFLVRKISTSLVENDERGAAKALKVLKTAFRPGTELYKELRLINALARTTVSAQSTASSVIQEAKNASKTHDFGALDREKSLLIRNINHGLQDDLFYEQSVADYRIYATIQTLINEWRRPSGDIQKVATYEDILLNHLMSEKAQPDDGGLVEGSALDSRLLVKAMTKRLNERYSSQLTTFQKDIIRSYALMEGDQTNVRNKLLEIKIDLLHEIDTYTSQKEENETKNLIEVRARIDEENLNELNDDVVSRFMTYSQLLDELRDNEGDEK